MITVFDFGILSVQKYYDRSLSVFIKDIGFFAYFYGGTSVITKHWN